jgi:hypothetical protein
MAGVIVAIAQQCSSLFNASSHGSSWVSGSAAKLKPKKPKKQIVPFRGTSIDCSVREAAMFGAVQATFLARWYSPCCNWLGHAPAAAHSTEMVSYGAAIAFKLFW